MKATSDEEILRRRARSLAERAVESAPVFASREELIVRAGDGRYALPLGTLTRVTPLTNLTVLPNVPKYIAGLTHATGKILTVVDLGVMLGHPPSTPGALLIVEAGPETLALGTSTYETVRPAPAGGYSPAPPGLTETTLRYLDGVDSSGTARVDLDRMIGDLLDMTHT